MIEIATAMNRLADEVKSLRETMERQVRDAGPRYTGCACDPDPMMDARCAYHATHGGGVWGPEAGRGLRPAYYDADARTYVGQSRSR